MYNYSFKLLFVFILSLFIKNGLYTQDAILTQFNQAPLMLNPAMTGIFNGKIRVTSSSRVQLSDQLKGDGYRYASLSADGRKAIGQNYLGYGLSVSRDQSGELKYGATQVKLALSFIKNFVQSNGNKHFLAIGQDIGITERRFNLNDARWPSQYDEDGMWIPNNPVVITLANFHTEFLHLDLASGIGWDSQLKGHNRFNLGFAVHHTNQPNISFYDVDFPQTLNARWTAYGSGEVALHNTISLTPLVAYHRQGDQSHLQAGAGIRKYINAESATSYFELSAQFRFSNTGWRLSLADDVIHIDNGLDSDAFILAFRGVLEKFSIGLSYDFSTVDANPGIGHDGFLELSLGYIFGPLTSITPSQETTK